MFTLRNSSIKDVKKFASESYVKTHHSQYLKNVSPKSDLVKEHISQLK